MKILLSWIGYDSDFLPRTASSRDIPNTDGPNISMHRYFEDRKYDRHIILYTPDARSLERKKVLEDYFSEDNASWPVHFKEIALAEDADVMSLNTLQMKLTALMLDFKDGFIDILATTGTKTMHTVWHLIHLAYRKRTRLLQIRPKQYTANGKPELITVEFNESHLPQTAIASERSLSHPIAALPFIATALEETYALAGKIALADWVPALILGESGTGKELLAKYILAHSARKHQPFKVINCAALLEDSLHITLFGQAGGSNRRKGIFEACDGGTLFLDEIGHLSPPMQLALLRVLQDGEILPLHATEAKRVDVRVIAATNHDILEACRTGKFRWDLYYRLAVVELYLPKLMDWPLRTVRHCGTTSCARNSRS